MYMIDRFPPSKTRGRKTELIYVCVSGFLLLLFNIYFYSMSKEKRISVRTEESEVNKIETKTKNKQKINKEPKKTKKLG